MIGLRPKRRTPAPTPEPVLGLTQTDLRERRRNWLRVTYKADFDLAAEVRDIVTPLARDAEKLPCSLVLRPEIENVADAVHEIVSTIIGMLAESRQLDDGAHARTARAVRDLAQRPGAPEISDDAITTGKWAVSLTRYAQPHTGDLAAYLGRAHPPGHPGLTGPSASERLLAALRVLDNAALILQRRIPKAAARQALPSIAEFNAQRRAQRDAERAERAVSKMRMKAGTTR